MANLTDSQPAELIAFCTQMSVTYTSGAPTTPTTAMKCEVEHQLRHHTVL
jgi:hypothetical protein